MEKRTLLTTVLLALATVSHSQISMEKTDTGILIKEGPTQVFFYQVEPESKNGQYERNNYIHPLWGIDGNVLTENFPDDHPHHRGIFWAWHQVWIDGKRIADGWEILNFTQEVTELEYYLNKEKQGVLNTEVLWESPLWKKDGEKVPFILEKTTITVHPRLSSSRQIDFEIRLQALEEGLSIGGSEDEKGYGGFSARLILPDKAKFIGEMGEITPKINAVEAGPFVNISGSFAKKGRNGGVAIICNPQNPGYPQPWILRDKNSMQNVVFPGREPVKLSITQPLVLKYSMIVYKDKMPAKRLKKLVGKL